MFEQSLFTLFLTAEARKRSQVPGYVAAFFLRYVVTYPRDLRAICKRTFEDARRRGWWTLGQKDDKYVTQVVQDLFCSGAMQ